MTLILTTVTPAFVVHTSDRLTSKLRNGRFQPHDIHANKTVIYRSTDGVAAISFSGLAYLDGIPTDSFLADVLWGSTISAGPDGEGPAMGFAPRPNAWTIDRAVGAIKRAIDALPQSYINKGGLYVLVSGWQSDRSKPKPFCREISRRPGLARALVSGTKRHWPYIGKTLCIGSVGASVSQAQVDAMLAPYRPAGRLLAHNAESAQVWLTRWIAAKQPSVGQHLISVVMPKPQAGPVECRFLPAAPHRAEISYAAGKVEIEVGHTPWVIAPHFFQPPQLHVGDAVIDLGGMELHLFGSPPAGGLLGLASSVQRVAP